MIGCTEGAKSILEAAKSFSFSQTCIICFIEFALAGPMIFHLYIRGFTLNSGGTLQGSKV